MVATTDKLFFFAVVGLLIAPKIVFAQIVITEIMYDLPSGSDSGREWIEVYNAGVAPVDLTKLRLSENGTNHKIVAVLGASTLAPASYAVIADNTTNFKTDRPNYSGALFDSVFSLSNDGETIGLRDASSTDIAAVSYTSGWGAAGDGNSLNCAPNETNAFVPRTPSPGAPMADGAITPKPKVQPAPTASKTKTTPTSRNSGSGVLLPTVESDSEMVPDGSSYVAVAETSSPYQWWIAVGALALATCAVVFVARRYAKTEWDIVEG